VLIATERQCHRQRFSAFGRIAAHRHLTSYATLVLAGTYKEAGESGRWQIQPGMLVVHAAGEAHADWFGGHATELISFEFREPVAAGAYWCEDPDSLVRRLLANERGSVLADSSLEPVAGEDDWPDQLAYTLRRDSSIAIASWAREQGLRPESVSRGFSRAYGVTPAAYRLGIRVKGAVHGLANGSQSLAEVALEHGFADQSHMTRALRAQIGCTPGELRKVKSVQEESFGRA
jgi:AraC-like DNA-binding protein